MTLRDIKSLTKELIFKIKEKYEKLEKKSLCWNVS